MKSYELTPETAGVQREQLIIDHLPQVRLIARQMHDRLPPDAISLDDLISAGVLGLIAAIDRFDPDHNTKLKTYAERKIRGAILDSLRELDWAPRKQRRKSKQIQSTISILEQRHQRMPEEEEIAAELELSIDEYRQWLVEIRGISLGSLQDTGNRGEGCELLGYLADSEEYWPSKVLERSELERLLAQAIERIPSSERMVLNLYYVEDLTMREVASIMDLHESRVSQLKSQAVLRLRSYIEKRWPVHRGT
jgi:RNA polymerase sigma factor for flagellar operon FliA